MKSVIVSIGLPLLLLLTRTSAAQIEEMPLNWQTPAVKSQTRDVVSKGLQIQKKSESEKKWSDCVTAAQSNWTKHPSVKGWILPSWLRCARELGQEKKNGESLTVALKNLDLHPELLLKGAWKNSLMTEALKSRFALLDLSSKAKPEDLWKQIEILLEFEDRLDNGQMAKVYSLAGELAQAKGQLKAAQFYFEKSLLKLETRNAREKLNSLLFALNEKRPEDKTRAEGLATEGNFEERFQASQKSNDLMTLLEDSLTYLSKYPGGLRSKWANDKILEIYLGFFERSQKDEKLKALRDRALGLMAKSDPTRVVDWARALHRRNDYPGCLTLSEKAIESSKGTAAAQVLYYMAGRCAQFGGQYDRAKKHFETLIEQYAGSDDLPEIYFRLGLTHLRLGQASSAIAVFEKLLTLKGADRFELSTLYWLARSLQLTNNSRAASFVDEILSRFPFSYYGLRLRLEKQNGVLEWPTNLTAPSDLKGTFFLTRTHKKILDRAELLSKSGWISEALAEVADLPMPNDAAGKALVARKLSELQLFPPVVRLLNEAGDLNPELRSLDLVRLGLPMVYREAIEEQASKQKLHPLLVRSLIRQESAFGPRAVSTSNAMGLMQLIGPTAQEVASELGLRGLKIPDDVFLADNNIQMGTYYLGKMIRMFGGSVPLGLAAYNAGPQRMRLFVNARQEVTDQTLRFSSEPFDEMWFDELPWYETSFYVKAILRNSIIYQLSEKADAKTPDQRRVQFGPVVWSHLVLPQ